MKTIIDMPCCAVWHVLNVYNVQQQQQKRHMHCAHFVKLKLVFVIEASHIDFAWLSHLWAEPKHAKKNKSKHKPKQKLENVAIYTISSSSWVLWACDRIGKNGAASYVSECACQGKLLRLLRTNVNGNRFHFRDVRVNSSKWLSNNDNNTSFSPFGFRSQSHTLIYSSHTNRRTYHRRLLYNWKLNHGRVCVCGCVRVNEWKRTKLKIDQFTLKKIRATCSIENPIQSKYYTVQYNTIECERNVFHCELPRKCACDTIGNGSIAFKIRSFHGEHSKLKASTVYELIQRVCICNKYSVKLLLLLSTLVVGEAEM